MIRIGRCATVNCDTRRKSELEAQSTRQFRSEPAGLSIDLLIAVSGESVAISGARLRNEYPSCHCDGIHGLNRHMFSEVDVRTEHEALLEE